MSLRVFRRRLVLVLAPLTVFTACAGDAGKDVPAPEVTRATIDTPAVEAVLDSAEQARVDSVLAMLASCPRDGRWHACSVERRLSQSGFRPVAEPDSTGAIPGLTGDALVWRLGRQQLRVVLFADSAAARAAMTGMDSLRAAPRGDTTVTWPDRATLLRSANAIGVLLGGTDRTVERLTDALLAGPPQP